MMMNTAENTRGSGDAGASAVEYGLIVFAIAAVIAVAVFALGLVTQETYSDACDSFSQEYQSTDC